MKNEKPWSRETNHEVGNQLEFALFKEVNDSVCGGLEMDVETVQGQKNPTAIKDEIRGKHRGDRHL